jgi:hypothetical protein
MLSIEIVKQYFLIGFTHVIPWGFDHILFIVSIFLLNSTLKSVIIQSSVFTIAHSLTLAITAADYFAADTRIIEPLIALSILFTSIENILHSKTTPYRLLIIFIFGLIHGMGFARALQEIGIPPNNFSSALLFFNLGVEFGQITVIFLAYILLSKWFSSKAWYNERIVFPISSVIACFSIYWIIERLFFVG